MQIEYEDHKTSKTCYRTEGLSEKSETMLAA